MVILGVRLVLADLWDQILNFGLLFRLRGDCRFSDFPLSLDGRDDGRDILTQSTLLRVDLQVDFVAAD